MKDERGDERRGYLVLCGVSICLCFHGVNRFVGHSPSRSAEVLAALRVALRACELPKWRALRTLIISNLPTKCAGAVLLWTF